MHKLLQNMPDPDEVVNSILSSLNLSYELLPLHLKRCLAYCSIFPKGYEFERDDLVKLRVSEGLLKSERVHDGNTQEDICQSLRGSLPNCCIDSSSNHAAIIGIVMPGAIHDLAQSKSVYECARVDRSGVQHGKLTMARCASFVGPI
jgi:hypothetical protein